MYICVYIYIYIHTLVYEHWNVPSRFGSMQTINSTRQRTRDQQQRVDANIGTSLGVETRLQDWTPALLD